MLHPALSEIEQKIPELKSQLEESKKLYFYPNIYNKEICITLIIYTYCKIPCKIHVYPDANSINIDSDKNTINLVEYWLNTFDTVRIRQQERAKALKQELCMYVITASAATPPR
jgi:hypothetical protein